LAKKKDVSSARLFSFKECFAVCLAEIKVKGMAGYGLLHSIRVSQIVIDIQRLG
jgi:hypothetical protein